MLGLWPDCQDNDAILDTLIERSPRRPSRRWPKFPQLRTLHLATVRVGKLITHNLQLLERIEHGSSFSRWESLQFRLGIWIDFHIHFAIIA